MIAIIGGGPSGIALGTCLDRQRIGYELFEAREIGATWKAAPPDLRVLSPWWTNALSPREALRGNPFRKPPANEYFTHLLHIASRLRGNVRESCKVTGLIRNERGLWCLHTQHGMHGPYSAVVLATGYFFSPSWPTPSPASDGSIRVLHAAEIRHYKQLEELRANEDPVIVVGRRVTAGQLIIQLHSLGIPCALSLRSPVEYRRHGFVAALRETAYFFWEELQSRLQPRIKRFSYPVMEGGHTRFLIESGQIATLPMFDRIEDGHLIFSDGTRLRAAAVIMATGYRATLELLPDSIDLDDFGVPVNQQFEIRDLPGVYVLGFDNLYDHRSRYLRGIRFDAARLADILAARLSAAHGCDSSR